MNYLYYTKEYSNNTESELSSIKGTKTDKLTILDEKTVKFLSFVLFHQYKKSNELYIGSYDILKEYQNKNELKQLQLKATIAKKLSNVCKDIYTVGTTETTNKRLIDLLEVAKNNEVLIY